MDVEYRARGQVPVEVVQLGRRLRASKDPGESRTLVTEFVEDLSDLGSLESVANLVDRPLATTALLCRTNGDALVVSRVLQESGIRHVLRRPLDELGAARWVGAVLADVGKPVIGREEVIELAWPAAPEIDPIEARVSLKEAEGRGADRGHLNLGALRDALRTRSTPAGLEASDDADVIVSTVHRAKGLEFDRVLIPVLKRRTLLDEDPDSEMRVTYVALSRARDDVFGIRLPTDADRMCRTGGRWAMAAFRGKRRYYRAIEVGAHDVVSVEPVVDDSGGAASVQEVLRSSDLRGAFIMAWLDPDARLDAPTFSLRTVEDGRVIGRTTAHFGRALVSAFGPRHADQLWPLRIEGMAVASVETVAGDPALTRDAGLPGSGLWLVPRLTGLAQPDWDSKSKE